MSAKYPKAFPASLATPSSPLRAREKARSTAGVAGPLRHDLKRYLSRMGGAWEDVAFATAVTLLVSAVVMVFLCRGFSLITPYQGIWNLALIGILTFLFLTFRTFPSFRRYAADERAHTAAVLEDLEAYPSLKLLVERLEAKVHEEEEFKVLRTLYYEEVHRLKALEGASRQEALEAYREAVRREMREAEGGLLLRTSPLDLEDSPSA